MNKKVLILSAAAVMLAAVSCKNNNEYVIPEWPWLDPSEVTYDWEDVSSDYGTLPEYIKIYKSPEKLLEQNAIAFIATADLTKTTFHVWGINAPDLNGSSEPLQTPKEVYDAQGNPAVVINAGFFYTSGGKSYSSSLEVSEGVLLSPNINYASEDWVTMYSPTRGVFLEHADGTYEAAWTFWKSATEHWIYQNPALNAYGSTPLQTPSADFPETGKAFEAVNGIGGGPVLLKNGEIRNTATAELFDGSNGIMVDGSHPRTAIGVTADKKLVLFVCEGRNMTEGVAGYTTAEVAQILKDFGCVDALNLDGGGSTLMLVNGTELIKPSDGKERSVGSCVYLK